MQHCTCNYIPRIALDFDMGDLCGLIAPRPFAILAGKEDPIFPLHGVQEGYAEVKQIYERMGALDNLTLVIGDGGHRFYAPQGWAELAKRF